MNLTQRLRCISRTMILRKTQLAIARAELNVVVNELRREKNHKAKSRGGL